MKSPISQFFSSFRNSTRTRNEESGVVNPTFEGEEDSANGRNRSYDSIQNKDNKEQSTTDRDQWGSPIEFLLSCVAMSVGLGNVWRFPFTAYENGGGAFLIPYVIILIFVGKPLYYMELCMGQFSSFGSVKVWEMVPAFKGVGYGQALATWCVVTYYVSLMALTVFYFFASFLPVLPWANCPQQYGDSCFDSNSNASILDVNATKPAAEIYYEVEVLHLHKRGLDDGIFAPEWRLSLCLLLSWIILFLTLVKGVKSSGKAAYFTALFPYFVLFILLIRGLTLPGAWDGVKFFITPQWEKLLEPQVWFKAVGQSFFSLSVGFGSITMFSSYNNFRHNVYRDATIISVTDTLTSFLAGFTIFAILGHLGHEMNLPVDQILKGGGSGLAFISYPDVLARFDVVPQLFAVLFFLMLFTLGVGSASALAGCIITIICDEFPNIKRWLVTLIVCISGFLLGLFYVTPQGQFILDLVDYYGGFFIIYILAFLEVMAVQWVYGMKNFIRDIEFMLGRKTGIYWRFCWAILIPLLLLVVFSYTLALQQPLKSGGYTFGAGANGFGTALIIIALGFVPLFLFGAVLKNRRENPSILAALRACFKASGEWCPKDEKLRAEYNDFIIEKTKSKMIVAEDYLGKSGVLHRTPWFHFKRILAETGFFLKELFWDD